MDESSPNILIAHPSPAWRDLLIHGLADHLFASATVEPGANLTRELARPATQGVIAQVTDQTENDLFLWISVLRHARPDWAIIALVRADEIAPLRKAFLAGADDCLADQTNVSELIASLANAIKLRTQQFGSRVGIAPPPDICDGRNLCATCLESTRALVAAVEAKDRHTRNHSVTVSKYATGLGRRMGLDAAALGHLRSAALLHDVGKIGVPDYILAKPGPLTHEEFGVVKRHPETALEILGHLNNLDEERKLILHHHERFDGRGYPCGLKGSAIPFGARILAVADSIDAMFSPRIYKPPFPLLQVQREISLGLGLQFDPKVGRCAIEWLEESPETFSRRDDDSQPAMIHQGSCRNSRECHRMASLRSTAGRMPPLR